VAIQASQQSWPGLSYNQATQQALSNKMKTLIFMLMEEARSKYLSESRLEWRMHPRSLYDLRMALSDDFMYELHQQQSYTAALTPARLLLFGIEVHQDETKAEGVFFLHDNRTGEFVAGGRYA